MSAVSAPRRPAPRLPRPAARYWKGKAPKGADALLSDSDDDEGDNQAVEGEEEGDVPIEDVEEDEEDVRGLEVRSAVGREKGKERAINVALRDVNISKEGKVIVAGREEVGREGVWCGV